MKNKEKNEISRRDFITVVWSFVTVLPFMYGAFRYISAPAKQFRTHDEKISVNSTKSEIQLDQIPENSSKFLVIDEEPVLLIRRSGSEFAAFKAECTHLGCTVGYRRDNNDIYCTCHGGKFDLNGNAAGGPPKHPLQKYIVSISGNTVTVNKPA